MAKADAREQVMGDANDEASDSSGDVADQGEVGNDNQHDDTVMVVLTMLVRTLMLVPASR